MWNKRREAGRKIEKNTICIETLLRKLTACKIRNTFQNFFFLGMWLVHITTEEICGLEVCEMKQVFYNLKLHRHSYYKNVRLIWPASFSVIAVPLPSHPTCHNLPSQRQVYTDYLKQRLVLFLPWKRSAQFSHIAQGITFINRVKNKKYCSIYAMYTEE